MKLNATGQPDFLQNPPSNPASPLFDGGEVANHNLMGGGNQSRAGRWYYATGFETGSLIDAVIVGASVAASGARGVWQGLYALNLITQATATDVASWTKQFLSQNSPSGRWGIEAMIAVEDRSCQVELVLNNATPVGTFIAALVLNIQATAAAMTLQYRSSTGSLIDVPGTTDQTGAAFALDGKVYHYLKLIADFSVNEYVRIVLDGVSYDLGSVVMQSGAPGSDVRQYAQVSIETLINGVAHANVDNLVISADEP